MPALDSLVKGMSSHRRETVFLGLVLLAGVSLRLNGLFWDAPYYFNPDEKRLIGWGMTYNYLDPAISEWGSLPLLLIKGLHALLTTFGRPDRADLYGPARTLSVLISGMIIGLTYWLTRQGYGRLAGLYAALFTAFTVLLIQYAHFYSLDVIFTFLVLLALLAIVSVAKKGRLRSYLLAGLFIGLAAATRLNGLLLLPSLLLVHLFQLRQRELKLAPKSLVRLLLDRRWLLALLLSGAIFFLLTPAVILDPKKYLFHDGLVWVLLQSQGYLKSQYTLQFEGTTPWYFVSNLLFWGAGPLLLLAYLPGVALAVLKFRRPTNLTVLIFLLLYCWTAAGARVKFIRYVLPLLPLLNLLAAAFFVWAQQAARRRPGWRWAATGLLAGTLLGTAMYALAFTTIYSRPDVRIEAMGWIEQNIPAGATIVHENDTTYAPPLDYFNQERSPYRFREINLSELYESGALRQSWSLPPWLAGREITVSRRGQAPVPFSSPAPMLSDEQKQGYLAERLRCADYLILSERHAPVYLKLADLFPVEHDYYRRLIEGELGFQLIKTFQRKPALFGRMIADDSAELTFRIFDHPTIWLFQAQLPPAYLDQQPSLLRISAEWADRVSLAGLEVGPTAVLPGEEFELSLYWSALAPMSRNYTIFLQLQNDDRQIIAQRDYQAAGGLLPTPCWHPGRLVVDRTRLVISPEAPPGRYRLKVGLYHFETLERLPLEEDTSGENALTLAEIEIVERRKE